MSMTFHVILTVFSLIHINIVHQTTKWMEFLDVLIRFLFFNAKHKENTTKKSKMFNLILV